MLESTDAVPVLESKDAAPVAESTDAVPVLESKDAVPVTKSDAVAVPVKASSDVDDTVLAVPMVDDAENNNIKFYQPNINKLLF